MTRVRPPTGNSRITPVARKERKALVDSNGLGCNRDEGSWFAPEDEPVAAVWTGMTAANVQTAVSQLASNTPLMSATTDGSEKSRLRMARFNPPNCAIVLP